MNKEDTSKELEERIKSMVGEMPNWIFDYLELSDAVKNEWRKGAKASEFGGHKTFVNKYTKELTSIITQHHNKLLDEVVEKVIPVGVPILFTKDEYLKALGDMDEIAKGTRYYLDKLREKQLEAIEQLRLR